MKRPQADGNFTLDDGTGGILVGVNPLCSLGSTCRRGDHRSRLPSDTLILRQASCMILRAIQVAPTALPATVPNPNISSGDYVVVIGRLLPGDSQSPSPGNYSVKAQKACP